MRIISIFLFAVLILLNSCKNKSSVDPSSYFTLNGESYSLTGGYLDDFGSNPDLISRDYDIILITGGIGYDATNEHLTGTGTLVYLDLNVNSTDMFVGGTFSWSTSRAPNTIVYGFAGVTCNAETGVCTYNSDAIDGNVSVEVAGDIYTVNFQLQLQDGQSVTGYYKGPLSNI